MIDIPKPYPEEFRRDVVALRDVDPAGETLDVTVAGTSESVIFLARRSI